MQKPQDQILKYLRKVLKRTCVNKIIKKNTFYYNFKMLHFLQLRFEIRVIAKNLFKENILLLDYYYYYYH